MERATIFDKMRLAAQREGELNSAIYFQILSFAHRALGLNLQDRITEFDAFKEGDFWHDRIDSLLKKANKEKCAGALVEQCTKYIQGCSASALTRLITDVTTILEINSPSKKAQQGGPGYPSQGAGSPDP